MRNFNVPVEFVKFKVLTMKSILFIKYYLLNYIIHPLRKIIFYILNFCCCCCCYYYYYYIVVVSKFITKK